MNVRPEKRTTLSLLADSRNTTTALLTDLLGEQPRARIDDQARYLAVEVMGPDLLDRLGLTPERQVVFRRSTLYGADTGRLISVNRVVALVDAHPVVAAIEDATTVPIGTLLARFGVEGTRELLAVGLQWNDSWARLEPVGACRSYAIHLREGLLAWVEELFSPSLLPPPGEAECALLRAELGVAAPPPISWTDGNDLQAIRALRRSAAEV